MGSALGCAARWNTAKRQCTYHRWRTRCCRGARGQAPQLGMRGRAFDGEDLLWGWKERRRLCGDAQYGVIKWRRMGPGSVGRRELTELFFLPKTDKSTPKGAPSLPNAKRLCKEKKWAGSWNENQSHLAAPNWLSGKMRLCACWEPSSNGKKKNLYPRRYYYSYVTSCDCAGNAAQSVYGVSGMSDPNSDPKHEDGGWAGFDEGGASGS